MRLSVDMKQLKRACGLMLKISLPFPKMLGVLGSRNNPNYADIWMLGLILSAMLNKKINKLLIVLSFYGMRRIMREWKVGM
jgi:hypothetical protein